VSPNQTFTLTKSGGVRLNSAVDFSLTNAGGTENLTIHTSCSQPIEYGDVFGSLTLVDYIGEAAIVGDLVWTDSDGDGIQDAGESGLANVTINLIWAGVDELCGTGDDQSLFTTTTDTNGFYEFQVPAVNWFYCVEFVAPTGRIFSPKDQGIDETLDSDANPTTGQTDPIYLSPIEIDLTADAGFLPEPADEQIDDIIDEFESSVTDGDLYGDGPASSAASRLKAFGNMLDKAQTYINAGNFTLACTQLEAAYERCDGMFPPPDFVAGPAAADMAASIQMLMITLGCI